MAERTAGIETAGKTSTIGTKITASGASADAGSTPQRAPPKEAGGAKAAKTAKVTRTNTVTRTARPAKATRTAAATRTANAAKAVSGTRLTIAARRARFLKILAATANVSRAARDAGVSSSSLYRHRAINALFAKAWDAAIGEALDALEEVLIERARDGVEKPVFFGGKVTGTVRVYSDQLGMFLLRARRPQIYDRAANGGQPVSEMSDKEAKAEFQRRLERVIALRDVVA